jgi:hypothetical protein
MPFNLFSLLDYWWLTEGKGRALFELWAKAYGRNLIQGVIGKFRSAFLIRGLVG